MATRSSMMTAPAAESRVSLATSTPSLEWLTDPIAARDFFENYWEKHPLVVNRHEPDYFSSLLSLDEVDRVITTTDRRYPDITLKNASKDVSASDFTVRGDGLDVARLYQLFDEGSTIALSFLDTLVPSLTLFCRSLESELSHPFQTNVYLTPPGAQGAKPHYDTHDVFVLQVEGSKKWTIYGTPVELPLSSQDFDASLHQLGEPTMQFVLEAGDMAYVPRGVVHDAHSTEVVSLHITAGVLRYTWRDLLLETVARASLEDPAFRRALPPGFAHSGFNRESAFEMMQLLLRRAATKPNLDAALDHFVDESIASSPPLLTGQMAQLAALSRLTLDDVVGVRPGVNYRLQAEGDFAALDCFGRKITFPRHAEQAIRFAVNHPRFIVRDLPGDLDDAGKLTLARRLIREGIILAFLS
jgi:ribosomal protein L16 Arg81 hydroxylase